MVEAFDTARSCLKSRDEWKISFRDLHEEMYTGLWKSLLGIKKVDEAWLQLNKDECRLCVTIS